MATSQPKVTQLLSDVMYDQANATPKQRLRAARILVGEDISVPIIGKVVSLAELRYQYTKE